MVLVPNGVLVEDVPKPVVPVLKPPNAGVVAVLLPNKPPAVDAVAPNAGLAWLKRLPPVWFWGQHRTVDVEDLPT